ncbi:MAG: methyl-accepting chemotaxis protein [Xanthobacteraceae bacterium]|nr:MAG: methyl-accepting chemotaxis protein [Xanthobacteraceae bacterium]
MRALVSSLAGIAGRFQGLRIGLRMQILLLGTVGVLLIGTIYLVGLRVENAAIHKSDTSIALQVRIADAVEKFIEARQVAGEFTRMPSERLIERNNELLAGVRVDLEGIEKLVADLPQDDPLRKATEWRTALNDYAKRFNWVVSSQRLMGFTEVDGLQGDLRMAARKMEVMLAKMDYSALIILTLQIRQYEKDYMLRGDLSHSASLKSRIGEFQEILNNSYLTEDQKKEVGEYLKAYQSSFESYVSGQRSLTEEAAALSSTFDNVIRPQLSGVSETAHASADAARQSMMNVRRTMIWALVVTTAVVILAAFLFGRRISRPITAMARAMERVAGGETDIVVPTIRRSDEIGVMARAFAVFHANMLENRELSQGRAAERQRNEEARKALLSGIADQLQADIGAAAREVETGAQKMHENVEVVGQVLAETRTRADTVRSASTQASENVQRIAAATRELAVSMAEISGQVGRYTQIARHAASDTERTDAIVQSLVDETQQIEEVVVLINGIAAQTNLLALNATIEAARAGEAGRGFAVVAQEVKALAQQVTSATGSIRQQIDAMRGLAQQAGQAINKIGTTVREIDHLASAMAGAVEQQQAATEEISGSITIAAEGTQTVSDHIGRVGEDAGQACKLSDQMVETAQAMHRQSGELNGVVARVLDRIRAA